VPNVNIRDSRDRDAVVKAESVGLSETIRYVGPKGGQLYTRKVLKSTVDHDYESLVSECGGPEKLGQSLIDSDPEVDLENFGLFLWNTSKVYIDSNEEVVYRVQQNEIIRTPSGKRKEVRPRKRAEANVDSDVPLTWTGRMIPKAEALRRYVFVSKLQIVHVNGLTFDFLYGMAKELAEANSLMLVSGGSNGKEPLVFRRGSVPYRGFLEGRIENDKYILLLHLSNVELKRPKKNDVSADQAEFDSDNTVL